MRIDSSSFGLIGRASSVVNKSGTHTDMSEVVVGRNGYIYLHVGRPVIHLLTDNDAKNLIELLRLAIGENDEN